MSGRTYIRDLSDELLIETTLKLDSRERKLTLLLLRHLGEIDRRRLYLRRGYSSMFDFCRRRLDYSEAAAGRRIRAARCIREHPEVAVRYERRELSVTTISRIHGILTVENSSGILDAVAGAGRDEVEMVVSRFRPRNGLREKVRPVYVLSALKTGRSSTTASGGKNSCAHPDPVASVTDDGESPPNPRGGHHGGDTRPCGPGTGLASAHRDEAGSRHDTAPPGRTTLTKKLKYRLEFGIDPELMEKIEKVKGLLSTKYPGNLSLELLLSELIDEYLDRHSPEARMARRKKRLASKNNGKDSGRPSSYHDDGKESFRHIPASLRDEIYTRDAGRCTFTAPDGTVCGSRRNLQIDHILPVALGGDDSPSNLRLLCRNHNQSEAERVLGERLMKRRRKRE